MHIAGDRRGVSEVIGALVIFAFLVIGFAGYQAVSVPDQNAEVEFQHNQEVAAEMMGVRDVILDAGYAETGSQRLSLGLRYPTRTFAVNPGTVVGTLDSTALGAYEFTGRGGGSAPTGVPSATEACGYESGTPSSTRITYQAGYSQYQPSPTIAYENSLTARAFPAPRDTTRVDTSQLIVRGDTIRLFPTNGSVSAAQVGPYPITATGGIANVVEVPANTEFTLRLPTRFSLSVWQDETDLADQPIVDSLESGGDGYINVNIDTGADSTTIWCRPVGLNGEPPAQELTPPTEQDTETGATDDASFETLVVDQSDTGSGVARYEVSYDVPADSPVETVEVLYNNRDSSYSTRTYTRSVGPDGGRENIEDYGWSYDPQTSGDEYRIVVVGLDESGDVVDSKVVADTADGGDPTWRDTLVESDSPTYDSASFTDTTPEFSAASYEFEYQVSDPSNFEEVELLIRNLDNGNVYQTSSSAPDGTISWQNPSYGNGDQYELVAQLQDADGVVVAQETFTDRADGSDGERPAVQQLSSTPEGYRVRRLASFSSSSLIPVRDR